MASKPTLTFITGNANKAAYASEALDRKIAHYKLDLDELQSLDPRVVVEHKVTQAHAYLETPVLVEDSSLVIHSLGRLPGPLVKWFLTELDYEKFCRLLDPFEDRTATASVCYGLHDGENIKFFENSVTGKISLHPQGERGFGWDPIFLQDGLNNKTRGELTLEEDRATSMRRKPLEEIAAYLRTQW